MFEIERARDRAMAHWIKDSITIITLNCPRKIGYNQHKGTETLVRHRESFEIKDVRDRESRL